MKRIKKSERQKRGLLNVNEVSRLIGVFHGIIRYHVELGTIPQPSTRLGDRLYYDQEQVKIIRGYFATREKGERQPDIWEVNK